MAEWDDENFEPKNVTGVTLSNKWEGEDEDDEVKESWEDEEEEKKSEEITETKPKPKKKNLQEKVTEKEQLKREEYERHMKDQPEEEMTPEEQVKREKESDLKFALDTTFEGNNKCDTLPPNKEEFHELAESLTKNIQQYSKCEEYPIFAENLIRGVCATLTSFDLKKIKTTVDNLYLEKQKIEKGDKAKKSKGKVKAKLRMEGDNLNQYSAYVDNYDEYDDFM